VEEEEAEDKNTCKSCGGSAEAVESLAFAQTRHYGFFEAKEEINKSQNF
jgi:hypothetical protein